MNRKTAVFCFRVLVLASLLGLSAPALASKNDGTLRIADQYDATNMDPIGHRDVPSATTSYLLFDTLIFLDSEGNVIPGLAESWELISPTEFKFKLRKGVKFHNGEEMTASDVKYSFDRAMGPAGARAASYTKDLKETEVLDDYTVVVRLKVPNYSFFPSLSDYWGSILNRKAVEAAGDSFGMNPVGTGPMKFVSWQKGNRYVLERFEDYWGDKPQYSKIEVRSLPEPTGRVIELESGGVDVSLFIPQNDMKRIEENKELVLYRKPYTSFTYLGFNTQKKPFNDPRVRQAIHAALDVVGIQKAVFRGVGRVPGSFVLDTTKYSIDKQIPQHVQDIELAKKLLAEAGVKDLKLQIWTNERKERVDMATIMQAQLAEVGITAEIKVLEWGAYINGLQQKAHDLFILGWTYNIPEPNFAIAGLLESDAGSNYTFYKNAELDELFLKGRTMQDGEERAAVYKKVQELIHDQKPMIPLHADEYIAGAKKDLGGLFTTKSNSLNNFRFVFFE